LPSENKVTIDTFKALNQQNNNKLASLKKPLHDLSRVDHPYQFKNPQPIKAFKIVPPSQSQQLIFSKHSSSITLSDKKH
jgi:hypothetical protein